MSGPRFLTHRMLGELARLRDRVHRTFKERSDDPLPLEWVGIASVASVGAFVWGWILGDWNFLQNILASIVVLGPGLLATNVLARNWRHKTDAKKKEEALVRL